MKKIVILSLCIFAVTSTLFGQMTRRIASPIDNYSSGNLPTVPGISAPVHNTFFVVDKAAFAKNPSSYDSKPTIIKGVTVNFQKPTSGAITCTSYNGLVAIDVDLGNPNCKKCFYMSKALYDKWPDKNQTVVNIAFVGYATSGYLIREIE